MKLILLPAAVSALVFASCAPSTPEARIDARPSLYQGLPAKHQELVRQGRIDKGMNTDAVYLAWGRPGREYEGSDGGVATLRWDYTGSAPVYSTHYFGGYGYGRYGRYGRYPYYGAGFGPEISYVPYRRATVFFRDGLVNSWERIR